MTENKQAISLQEYNKEIQPMLHSISKKTEILNEWKKEDATIAEFKLKLKEIQEEMKKYVEDTESELVREINDLKTDFKLAVKGCAKSSGYKPKEINSFMIARFKQKVEEVKEKAELFDKLNNELA